MKNESLKKMISTEYFDEWILADTQLEGGDRKQSRISGRPVYQVPAARTSCKSQQVGVESLGRTMSWLSL